MSAGAHGNANDTPNLYQRKRVFLATALLWDVMPRIFLHKGCQTQQLAAAMWPGPWLKCRLHERRRSVSPLFAQFLKMVSIWQSILEYRLIITYSSLLKSGPRIYPSLNRLWAPGLCLRHIASGDFLKAFKSIEPRHWQHNVFASFVKARFKQLPKSTFDDSNIC